MSELRAPSVGLSGRASMVVGDADTAAAMGSGSLAVLATPRVVALCEQATCVAVVDHLADGWTTVGTKVELDHLRATAVGSHVTAHAVLEEIDRRRLTFVVSVSDTNGAVAAGKVTRVGGGRPIHGHDSMKLIAVTLVSAAACLALLRLPEPDGEGRRERRAEGSGRTGRHQCHRRPVPSRAAAGGDCRRDLHHPAGCAARR